MRLIAEMCEELGISKWIGYTVVLVVFLLVAAIFVRVTFLTWVDNYQLGYTYNSLSGKIERLPHGGYIAAMPFIVSVQTVDLRPQQVCISAIQRVLNCKLVQFDPAGLELFLSWHGRDNYYNAGSRGESSQFNQILMAYAYEGSGKNYPFLRIIRQLDSKEMEEAQ